MYICKECGQKYKIKPPYCDCGNDEFEEPQSIKKVAKNRLERMGISPFALLFFLSCVMLSLLILFAFNPKPQNTNTPQTAKTTQTKQNIPSIDKLWIETEKKIQTNKTTNQHISQVAQTIVATPKTTQKSTSAQILQKPKTTVTNKTPATKTQTNPKTKTTTSTTNSNKAQAINTQPVTNTKTPNKTVTKSEETVTKKEAKIFNQELYNYKLQLRQALFSKLSIASIQGNGKCEIEFAIDSTGKLINRNFSQQSQNKSINDEVYKMLMRLPKYYPPPKGYNGEKIKIVFIFNNGSYSINYTN